MANDDFIRLPSIPARDHSACRLALCALHARPSRRRRFCSLSMGWLSLTRRWRWVFEGWAIVRPDNFAVDARGQRRGGIFDEMAVTITGRQFWLWRAGRRRTQDFSTSAPSTLRTAEVDAVPRPAYAGFTLEFLPFRERHEPRNSALSGHRARSQRKPRHRLPVSCSAPALRHLATPIRRLDPAPNNTSQLPNRNIGCQSIGSKGCAS